MDLFSLFTATSYTFLELSQGTGGNSVVKETAATGVIKYRDGMVQTANTESVQSDATIHIRPDEPFISEVGGQLIGHGIRADGEDYRIVGATTGQDYDLGVTQFYRCTLKKESLWVSALPLE
jgi:hypothetical protein